MCAKNVDEIDTDLFSSTVLGFIKTKVKSVKVVCPCQLAAIKKVQIEIESI